MILSTVLTLPDWSGSATGRWSRPRGLTLTELKSFRGVMNTAAMTQIGFPRPHGYLGLAPAMAVAVAVAVLVLVLVLARIRPLQRIHHVPVRRCRLILRMQTYTEISRRPRMYAASQS